MITRFTTHYYPDHDCLSPEDIQSFRLLREGWFTEVHYGRLEGSYTRRSRCEGARVWCLRQVRQSVERTVSGLMRDCSDEMVKADFFQNQVYPRVPGHEIIGDVVAIGKGEQLWKVGDRVGAGWHGGHCGSCTRCRIGDFVTCSISASCPTGG